MDIASLVLGIISIFFSFFCWFISIITAPIGLILGIIDFNKKKRENNPSRGMAISGIVLSSISLVIVIILIFFLAALSATGY